MMYTNNCLPHYFFGDAKMNQDDNEQSNKININLSDDVHVNVSSIPSPSSSLASTKKLEWDSGADIGYIYDSVKNHRKSKSYPSLNMDLDVDKAKPKEPPMVSIGEGDTLNVKTKKPKTFKHSTPIHEKRVIKSCGDSGTLDQVVNKTSKEVQTDDKVQKVENADKSLQTDTLKSSSQTSSSSKSGSFKFIPGSQIASYSTQSNSMTSKSSKNKTETSETNETNETSGSCSPLGQMISTQHSQNLITDIDKSLAILHKFIKSKNYSNDTKKHYAKKIVTKIINNRYSDDSDSVETSPQLNKNKEFVDCGVQCSEIEQKSQQISEKSSCQIKQSLDKLNALQVDLKNWRDAQTLSEKLFEARKNKIKTRETESSSDDKEKDYLVRHSKNERKRQISWINNEISYLQKLKDLLQIKPNTSNTSNVSSLMTSSTTSKKSVVENIDDIEKRFNEEFGLPTSSVTLKDNKLSKYLSNEQIKNLVETTNTNKNKDSSFNSHKNSIYADKTSHFSTKIVDASTQYSFHEPKITKTKETPFNAHLHNATPLNVANFEAASSSSSTSKSSCDESLIIEQHVPLKLKPNSLKIKPNLPKIKPNNNVNKVDKKLSTAYFLTFEEESQTDADYDDDERQSLEQVVVKIPKPRHVNVANSVNVKNKGCSRTLEEYLIRNRPHFVENANWRWAQVNQQSIFSCFEMKEMTRKKYNNLPEIQEQKQKYRTLVERTHNRFKANMFSRKLQKKTLQGHICLATCKSVMASD